MRTAEGIAKVYACGVTCSASLTSDECARLMLRHELVEADGGEALLDDETIDRCPQHLCSHAWPCTAVMADERLAASLADSGSCMVKDGFASDDDPCVVSSSAIGSIR